MLAVFALYRLASLVSSDEGPYIGWPKSEQQIGIFKAIRIKAGAYNYGPDGLPETNLGRGIACPLCTAAYLGIFPLLLSQIPTRVGDLVLTYLGIYGAQVFLENLTSDDAIQSAIEDVADSLEE
jgi:hypothetical protein